MPNTEQYCTVLNVKNVISTNVFGITLWGATVEFFNGTEQRNQETVYFLTKKEALNFEIGDRFLK